MKNDKISLIPNKNRRNCEDILIFFFFLFSYKKTEMRKKYEIFYIKFYFLNISSCIILYEQAFFLTLLAM